VPLTDALAEASVVACHGGSGTVLGALAAGTPMAVLPLFADQPYNARRIARLGAGLEVAEPAAVGEAVRRLLADGSFAAVASSVAAEIDALAPIEAAPALAHDLVERRVAA
jgi:UDP:flavonoid glycosyltransferase YjiC (YdhE family)